MGIWRKKQQDESDTIEAPTFMVEDVPTVIGPETGIDAEPLPPIAPAGALAPIEVALVDADETPPAIELEDATAAAVASTEPEAASEPEASSAPNEPDDVPRLGDAGEITVSHEGDMRVLEIEVARGVGVRLLDAPIGPAFTDLTLTGIGPGKQGPGPSLTVSGHLVTSHRGSAVLHGTSRGPGHADFGEPCQDACGSRALSEDVVAIMAADGVSAGADSGVVAQHAIDVGLALLPITPTGAVREIDMKAWIDALNAELAAKVESIAAERPGSTGNATTLAIAIIDLVERSAVVVRVGDASAWLFGASDALQPVLSSSKEQDDGLVSGKSTALPSRAPSVEGVIADLAESSAILVCTDGIGDELVAGRSRYAQWLSRFLAVPVDPVSFAYAIGMRSRGATDDRGGAVCWLPAAKR